MLERISNQFGENLQQITLQTQCHWGPRILDRVTRFVDVDIEDLFARDGPERRLRAKRGHQPAPVRRD